jgi:hypothetical protein
MGFKTRKQLNFLKELQVYGQLHNDKNKTMYSIKILLNLTFLML